MVNNEKEVQNGASS